MSQSLVRIAVHLIFSTKHRTPWLKDPELRRHLYAYMATVLKSLKSPAIVINGVEDHVHLLFNQSKTISISDLVQNVKQDSSKWIKTNGELYRRFSWQAGYGAFSVDPVNGVPALRVYILNQEEHHRRETFQDEFRRLCMEHGVPIDERYVWD